MKKKESVNRVDNWPWPTFWLQYVIKKEAEVELQTGRSPHNHKRIRGYTNANTANNKTLGAHSVNKHKRSAYAGLMHLHQAVQKHHSFDESLLPANAQSKVRIQQWICLLTMLRTQLAQLQPQFNMWRLREPDSNSIPTFPVSNYICKALPILLHELGCLHCKPKS